MSVNHVLGSIHPRYNVGITDVISPWHTSVSILADYFLRLHTPVLRVYTRDLGTIWLPPGRVKFGESATELPVSCHSWSYRPDFPGDTDQTFLVTQTRLSWWQRPDFPGDKDQTFLVTQTSLFWSHRPHFSDHTDLTFLVTQTSLSWSHRPDCWSHRPHFPGHTDLPFLVTQTCLSITAQFNRVQTPTVALSVCPITQNLLYSVVSLQSDIILCPSWWK